MARRATRMTRALAEETGTLKRVTDEVSPALRGLRLAGHHNALYEAAALLALVALAAGSGVSIHGCLELREVAAIADRLPSSEWALQALRGAGAAGALRALRATGARHLRTLRRRGELPLEVAVAVDKRGMLRYGRANPGWLVRARSERGSTRREAYMTAQCVTNGKWITLDAVRISPLDPAEGAFSIMLRRVRAACRRAGVVPVLVMDREFFSTGVLAQLERAGVRWVVPCPNTPRVVEALRDFVAGLRGRSSTMAIADAHGREAPYAMIIERRRRPDGDGPEERHIAFASSSPGMDVDAPCPRRWGIEIGHRMAKHTSIRTSSRDEGVRIVCFVLSLMVHGAWVMLQSGALAGGTALRIPQGAFKILLILGSCNVLGIRPDPEPPPPVAP